MATKRMTVKELIEKLSEFDADQEVHIAYNYGDHWRTMVAPHVREVEEAEVKWSEYHSMPKIADDDADETLDTRPVVVLR
jgi:hypothetical protein